MHDFGSFRDDILVKCFHEALFEDFWSSHIAQKVDSPDDELFVWNVDRSWYVLFRVSE